jgi:hypothetical protein
MVVEKRVPNVYGQYALLDAAAEPFVNVPGRLVVSEYAESLDWSFILRRQDGALFQAVLPTEGRMQSDTALVKAIRDGLTAMLAA